METIFCHDLLQLQVKMRWASCETLPLESLLGALVDGMWMGFWN
jgi:hypothetical protein